MHTPRAKHPLFFSAFRNRAQEGCKLSRDRRIPRAKRPKSSSRRVQTQPRWEDSSSETLKFFCSVRQLGTWGLGGLSARRYCCKIHFPMSALPREGIKLPPTPPVHVCQDSQLRWCAQGARRFSWGRTHHTAKRVRQCTQVMHAWLPALSGTVTDAVMSFPRTSEEQHWIPDVRPHCVVRFRTNDEQQHHTSNVRSRWFV